MTNRYMDPYESRPSFFPAPLHPFESERLEFVRRYKGYAGEDGPMLSIARQAARACEAAFGMVSLMDEHQQRFLACVGASRDPVDRDETFCAYCILQSEPMVVENALEDARFCGNPHVIGERNIRFYVGAPILDHGLPLGTVCVVDTKPHEVSSKSLLMMERLAERASAVLQLRRMVSDWEALDELLMPLVER